MPTAYQNDRYNPCHKCPDRYPACSGHCQKPEFLEWKAEQEKIRKARKDYRPPQVEASGTDAPEDLRAKQETMK